MRRSYGGSNIFIVIGLFFYFMMKGCCGGGHRHGVSEKGEEHERHGGHEGHGEIKTDTKEKGCC